MSEENTPATTTTTATEGGQQQQVNIQVQVDEKDLHTAYSNNYRIYQTAEGMVMDFIYEMPHPFSNGQQPAVLLKLNDRVIMSYPGAKRLMLSLQQFIKRFEQQFGEIPTQPNQQAPRK